MITEVSTVLIIFIIIFLIYKISTQEFFEPDYNYAANLCLLKTQDEACNTIVGINERPHDKYIPKNFIFF